MDGPLVFLGGSRLHRDSRWILDPLGKRGRRAWLVCSGEGAGEWLIQNIMYRHRSKHIHTQSHTHTHSHTVTHSQTHTLTDSHHLPPPQQAAQTGCMNM